MSKKCTFCNNGRLPHFFELESKPDVVHARGCTKYILTKIHTLYVNGLKNPNKRQVLTEITKQLLGRKESIQLDIPFSIVKEDFNGES